MPKLSLIVAIAHDGVIGVNNTLPWHLPEDLKRFRALTMGHHIIMGRKTYESLNRLLPGRTTVIVTRNADYRVEGALIASSLQDAILQSAGDDEVFLIGGAELYREGLVQADRLYITEIEASFSGDAFFPAIDYSLWRLVAEERHVSVNGLIYRYLTYDRLIQT
ncbi:dihydrofolate reductase [Methylovorus glucosotrophus]|uniref:dihydrofolate reductase n=1 Tax=Methylovorus glucosotrophus TaxID=266009 RepID=UPI00133175F3|nr:dihydrofolate reductase [Methylovorus glucosotrophus]KAF0844530.1 dihydrofolate reductase [Methylovorus glucosotrophus]